MMYSGIYNLVGLPAISVPCGMSSEGLPSGLQVVTSWHKDELALSIGLALELHSPLDNRRCRHSGWHESGLKAVFRG